MELAAKYETEVKIYATSEKLLAESWLGVFVRLCVAMIHAQADADFLLDEAVAKGYFEYSPNWRRRC